MYMKTNLFLLLTLLLAGIAVTSCGDSPDAQLQNLENQYIAACGENDFDKARSIVSQMEPLMTKSLAELKADAEEKCAKAMDDDRKSVREIAYEAVAKYEAQVKNLNVDRHIKYINDKEIYYLLAHATADNNKRIMYLYNTYEASQLPDMADVAEVAISQDNEQLSTKLIKAGVQPTAGVIKAAVNADMSDLVQLIIQSHPEMMFDQEVAKYYAQACGDEKSKSLMGKLLTDKVDELHALRVPARPQIGQLRLKEVSSLPKSYKEYKNSVDTLNKACIEVITLCVAGNRPDIAAKALNLMKPSIDWTELGNDLVDLGDRYEAYYKYSIL